jgi:hypothetical protein
MLKIIFNLLSFPVPEGLEKNYFYPLSPQWGVCKYLQIRKSPLGDLGVGHREGLCKGFKILKMVI